MSGSRALVVHVEVAGIEPASSGTDSGLLRAQFVDVGLALLVVTTRQHRTQLLFDVPATGPQPLGRVSLQSTSDPRPEALRG